jgi:Concanavalin A-like lectin/glucanases superfamily
MGGGSHQTGGQPDQNGPSGKRHRGRALHIALCMSLALVGVFVWVALAGGTQPYETYESRVSGDGPVAQFRFDDAVGSSKVADSAGSDAATNNGITLGGEGPFGGSKSGSFAGEAYAALPAAPLEGTKEWTAEVWVNWSGGASYKQPVFDFGSSSTNYIYLTPASALTGHKLLLEIHTSGGASAQVTAPKPSANSWHYVAITETSAGTLTLYEEGEQVAQTTGATVFPSSLGSTPTDYLGKPLVSGDPTFKGSLSNVAFYTKALSAGQIETHWNDAEFPVNTALPSILGNAKDGSTLTAKTGSWSGLTPITFAYQWTHCNASGEACINIPSANESKYTAKSEDVGSTLRAVITATNSAGPGTATTPATARVEAAAPVNTTLPSISGQAKDGQLLSVGNGAWEGTPPLSYSYQWEVCTPERCKKLTGATGSTYRVIGSEIGETLRAAVTAGNAAGSKLAKSAPTATITAGAPVSTSPPTISGEAKDGKTLTGSLGTWAGTAPISFGYQWQRCDGSGAGCANVSGATSTSYALSTSDVGHAMRFVLTGTNAQSSTPASSDATPAVAAIPPANTTPPSISGTPEDGHALTANAGSWSGSPSISYTYQWQRCDSAGGACGDISGATESGYTAGHADVGSTLRVEVTATNAAGPVSVGSDATSPVAALAPANTTAPSISGEARDGQDLSAASGEWSGTPPISFVYRWQRCGSDGTGCSDISGATEATYAVNHEDVGHTLRVEVTASNAGGSASETSAASLPVAALVPSNVAPPTISGEAKVGQQLTAGGGEWAGTAPLSYSYQWENCDQLGEGCLAISGATAPTYTPSASDAGTTLRVAVVASNSAGEADASSSPTTLVTGATECTDTWTGAAGDGLWQTATNWSSGSAPSSSDHACIGPETTVQVTSAGNAVASVKDEGVLLIDDGSLEITDAEDPSTIAALTLDGGTLSGAATLHVSQALSLSGNSTISTLTVLLEATASSATVETCARLVLDGATLVNEGAFTLAPNSAALWLQSGAQLRNGGTFTDESVDPACGYGTVGFSIYNAGESAITNTGTFHADGGSGNTLVVQAPFDNKGAVIAESGTLELSEGGVPEQVATGSWAVEGYGAIVFANGTFLINEGVDLSHVEITAATVEIAGKGPPVSGSEPDLSGEADVGRLVSTDTGHWTGARPLSYAYQWRRCDSEGEGCVDIEGAIESSYVPTVEDVGRTLRVSVTATNTEGSAASESAPTSIVGFPPVNTAPPAISGTAQDGQTLSATTGTWEGGSTISYSYQWQRCGREEGGGNPDIAPARGFGAPFDASGEGCTDIEGATSSTFTLQDEDVEAAVRVVVTAQDADGGASEVSGESETVLPPAAPEPLTAPTISGTAQRGRPLSASQGGWRAVGAVSYAYQWQRCDSAGDGCADISSATASTYVPGASDVDHTLRIVVTASNVVGSTSNSSMPTGIVAETNCTDTWTGPSAGASWSTVANWSAGHAPGSADVACIGPGTTVQIATGTNTAGELEDEGALALTGGSLALADSSRPSSVASLNLRNADLAGPGSLYVSGSFTLAGNGELTGSGSLVIEPGAKGAINAASGCEPMTLSDYTLVNEGVLEYVWGTLDMASGATLENKGTLDYETRSSCHEPQIGLTGEGAQILNAGTFERLAQDTGGIGVPFNNGGTVEAQSGRLEFSGGGVPEEVATGSWKAPGGSIALTAGTFLIGDEVDLSQVEVTGATVVRTALEAPSVVTPPSISGELVVGKTLSASTGTWHAVPQPSYAYQWERCEAGGEGCSDIAGATSQQYELVPDDADATVRVRVTATNTKGSAASTSAATEAIAPAPPVDTTAPAISGTTEDGKTLTASTGVWEASPPLSYAYRWQRCVDGGGSCTNIEGATSPTYALGHEDVGFDIEVVVTATNPGGSTESNSELTSRIVPAPPADTAPPTLSGKPSPEKRCARTPERGAARHHSPTPMNGRSATLKAANARRSKGRRAAATRRRAIRWAGACACS